MNRNAATLFLIPLLLLPCLISHAADQKEIAAHLEWRKQLIESSSELSAPRNNDRAENLLDELRYDSLTKMDEDGLTSATLSYRPWSDSYWPHYLGVLAFRYGDPNYPLSRDWQVNYDYVMSRLGKAADIADLSPAEKYDLLVGARNFRFTNNMFELTKRARGRDGSVPKWLGICHGWAPASYLVDRPKRMVNVLAADGETIIPFYPSDIKALISDLWASAKIPVRYIGGRCQETNPRRDRNGRRLNLDCLDSNPATWHLAVVNQLGYEKRTFIMDSVNNVEVWNYPIVSYQYKYFNPRTKQPAPSLEDATVDVSSFPEDKFKPYRASGTKFLVGISMAVTYVDEAPPKKREIDNESFDLSVTVNFQYDLELDRNGHIIGGEWYSENYPDFLWQPLPGVSPESSGDRILDKAGDREIWRKGKTLPQSWIRAAAFAALEPQPLARIIEDLIRLANE